MAPRRTPEEIMQDNIARMAQAMTGMTQFMTRQATINNEQAAANAQRQAAEEARQMQRQQWEEAAAQTKGLNDFRRHDPPKFLGDTDLEKAEFGFNRWRRSSRSTHT